MAALFAYGTLQHPEIMEHVLGRIPERTPGDLAGYARYRMDGYRFPGIIPVDGAITDGTLFSDITEEEWKQLDHYEADFYVRTPVFIKTATGETCRAYAYVVPPHNRNLITDEPWDLNTYQPGPDSGIH